MELRAWRRHPRLAWHDFRLSRDRTAVHAAKEKRIADA